MIGMFVLLIITAVFTGAIAAGFIIFVWSIAALNFEASVFALQIIIGSFIGVLAIGFIIFVWALYVLHNPKGSRRSR